MADESDSESTDDEQNETEDIEDREAEHSRTAPPDESEVAERVEDQPTLTLEVPLDDAHEPLADELEEFGVDVSTAVTQQSIRQLEAAIYQTYQNVKYQNLG